MHTLTVDTKTSVTLSMGRCVFRRTSYVYVRVHVVTESCVSCTSSCASRLCPDRVGVSIRLDSDPDYSSPCRLRVVRGRRHRVRIRRVEGGGGIRLRDLGSDRNTDPQE